MLSEFLTLISSFEIRIILPFVNVVVLLAVGLAVAVGVVALAVIAVAYVVVDVLFDQYNVVEGFGMSLTKG